MGAVGLGPFARAPPHRRAACPPRPRQSFLELVAFYKKLLREKAKEVDALIHRLDTGLTTLRNTEKTVAELQQELKARGRSAGAVARHARCPS